jgi:hypothetical protein
MNEIFLCHQKLNGEYSCMVFYRGEAKKGKRRENVITKMTCDAL